MYLFLPVSLCVPPLFLFFPSYLPFSILHSFLAAISHSPNLWNSWLGIILSSSGWLLDAAALGVGEMKYLLFTVRICFQYESIWLKLVKTEWNFNDPISSIINKLLDWMALHIPQGEGKPTVLKVLEGGYLYFLVCPILCSVIHPGSNARGLSDLLQSPQCWHAWLMKSWSSESRIDSQLTQGMWEHLFSEASLCPERGLELDLLPHPLYHAVQDL